MWYECIPSMAIITVCMSLGNVAAWGVNKLVQGNVSKTIHIIQLTLDLFPSFYPLLYNAISILFYSTGISMDWQAYNRVMDERWDRILFTRDKCLTGDPYKCNVRQSFNLSIAYTLNSLCTQSKLNNCSNQMNDFLLNFLFVIYRAWNRFQMNQKRNN